MESVLLSGREYWNMNEQIKKSLGAVEYDECGDEFGDKCGEYTERPE